MTRLLLAHVLLLAGSVAACDGDLTPLSPTTTDTKGADPSAVDAGVRPGDEPGAGADDENAGLGIPDSPPMPPGGIMPKPTDVWPAYTCEGDEDFCNPTPKVQAPDYAILATWSHVEGDNVVVQLLFSGHPYASGFGQLELLFRTTDDESDDVLGTDANPLGPDETPPYEPSVNGDYAVWVMQGPHWNDSGDVIYVYYPPTEVGAVVGGPAPQQDNIIPNAQVWFRAGGHVVQITLPLADVDPSGSPLQYALGVDYSADLTCGDLEAGTAGVRYLASRAGTPDFLDPSESFVPPTLSLSAGYDPCPLDF